ncbi:NAD(P)H-dependent oxidoreductase [Zoogloea sp.]|uniref:NAD(P)H-dependent oxidoreductase n=1 Tax=Zoogloea sp. TaxID=49181 RepID=UPI0014167DAA|nr:MAG: NAD(P)H-dependent oxidoreductase [Zoogloea sp.]
MNVLIVFAHNEPRSFNAAMKDLSVDTLEAAGHAVQVSDLYAMGFNPVASAADFSERTNPDYLVYALEQRHAYNKGALAPDIAAEVDKVKWADLIIFNFPIYWYGMPAIMKGWIDRVFISGLCYGGRRIYDRGGLKGKSALLAISLGGQAHMFGPGAVHGELEVMLQPILRGMLAYVGLRVLPPYVAYHVPYLEEAERRSILEGYGLHLQGLDQLEALRFPSLDDFDETLRPL